jgi:cellulose synthase/poly-beta-1,6-N-acetylglucosamine synthase-like glycosyltransferase
MNSVLTTLLHVFTIGVLAYFCLMNVIYFVFIALSLVGTTRHRRQTQYLQPTEIFASPMAKPVSVLVPAYNEAAAIVESVLCLLSLEYPQYEVIVINDGSTDDTLARLVEAFGLARSPRVFRRVIETKPVLGIYTSPRFPRLVVVDKANGRKADALNAGLNVARYPLFCAIDSDSVVDRDALIKVVRPFIEDPEHVVGAGGIVRLNNGCRMEADQSVSVRMPRNIFARFQVIEYFRAFLGGRMGMSMLKSMLIISGAFGIFRKDLVLESRGYRTDTLGEDLDLVIRLTKRLRHKKARFRFEFIPDPICWTEAPESFRSLASQRNRWHRGLLETFIHNRRMIFNPRYGVTGLFAMPFYLIFELLGPLVELSGYTLFVVLALFGHINYPFTLLFLLFSVVLGTLLSFSSLLLEELAPQSFPRAKDIVTLALYSILENLVYRQILALVRAKAFLDFLLGRKEWGVIEKKGFARRAQET